MTIWILEKKNIFHFSSQYCVKERDKEEVKDMNKEIKTFNKR